MRPTEVIAGRFRLLEHLGSGGMGEVWSAEDAKTDREVAIKFMHGHVASARGARQRFLREAVISSRVAHPNIVEMSEVLELPGGGLGIVMERLEGVTLHEARFSDPPLSAADLCAILLDVARALDAAHAIGVVHRDIKPANIFLHQEKQSGLVYAKVLDFGVSKLAMSDDGIATNTGSLLGSPRFMSPEQVRSASLADHRSDLWAAGIIMFEALVGQWPHDGDGFHALLVAIGTKPPIDIDRAAPELPAGLRAVVRKCLSPLELRYQSALELAQALEALLDEPSLGSIPLRSRVLGIDDVPLKPSATPSRLPASPTFASAVLGRAMRLGGSMRLATGVSAATPIGVESTVGVIPQPPLERTERMLRSEVLGAGAPPEAPTLLGLGETGPPLTASVGAVSVESPFHPGRRLPSFPPSAAAPGSAASASVGHAPARKSRTVLLGSIGAGIGLLVLLAIANFSSPFGESKVTMNVAFPELEPAPRAAVEREDVAADLTLNAEPVQSAVVTSTISSDLPTTPPALSASGAKPKASAPARRPDAKPPRPAQTNVPAAPANPLERWR